MLPHPDRALARAAIGVATIVIAIVVAIAGPASAAARRVDDLADAARQTLADLRAAQLHRLAAASGAEDPSVSAAADALYRSDLDIVAAFVSPRTASPPEAFTKAWPAAGDTRMTVLLSALAEVGVPYRLNASEAGHAFDCSGLTMYAWAQVGVDLAHYDRAQIAAATSRTWATAAAGDLVQYPGHIMLYAGAGHAIIDAPHTGAWVRVIEYRGHSDTRLGSPIG
jgi:cell wall-associated NlpC family hydrolase